MTLRALCNPATNTALDRQCPHLCFGHMQHTQCLHVLLPAWVRANARGDVGLFVALFLCMLLLSQLHFAPDAAEKPVEIFHRLKLYSDDDPQGKLQRPVVAVRAAAAMLCRR